MARIVCFDNVSFEAELDTNPDLAVLKCLIGDLGGGKAVLVYLCRSDPLDQFRVGQLEEILIFRWDVHFTALEVEGVPEQIVIADEIQIVGPA